MSVESDYQSIQKYYIFTFFLSLNSALTIPLTIPRFFTPILASISPIANYTSSKGGARPTASPLSMTSSSGVSSLRPSTASPAPAGYPGGPNSARRLPAHRLLPPPPQPKTPIGSSLGTLSRTPRFL